MRRFIALAALVAFLPVLFAATPLVINIGNTANDGTGDSLRTAFGKINTNFANLYGQARNSFDTNQFTITAVTNVAIASGSRITNLVSSGTLTVGGIAYTFPASQASNRYLQTDGSGILSWSTVNTTPYNFDTNYFTVTGSTNVTVANLLTQVPISNAAFVSKGGSDSTGTVGRFDKPYLTVSAAITASSSGTTVIVFPGSYDEQITFKDGVNIHLTSGTTLTYSNSSDTPAVRDNGSAVTANITGDGVISRTGSTGSSASAVSISGASTVNISARTISTTSTSATGAVSVTGGATVTIRGNLFSGGAGFYVNNASALAKLYGNIVATNDYGFWVGNGTAIMEGDIDAQGNSAITSTANGYVYFRNGHALSRYLFGLEQAGGSVYLSRAIIESTRNNAASGSAISKYGGDDLVLDSVQLVSTNASAKSIESQGDATHGTIYVANPSFANRDIQTSPALNIVYGQIRTPSYVSIYASTNLIARVDATSGYAAGGTKYLSDDGTYKTVSSGTTINPDDGYLPYRTSSTTFGNSPWYRISSTSLGFGSTAQSIYRDANSNTSFGLRALDSLSSGSQNTAVGEDVLTANTAANQNTGIGTSALSKATTGDGNVAAGVYALQNLTTGTANVAVGVTAGQNLTIGGENTVVGNAALILSTNGNYNTALGVDALRLTTTSDSGTGVGWGALRSQTTGTENSALGVQAAYWLTTGNGNVAIGRSAASNILTGSYNVSIGYQSGSDLTSATNTVGIGTRVRIGASNTAQIGTNGVSVLYLNGTVGWYRGSGTPEGSVTANIGSFYSREDGGASTSFYVKESGTGNTGWVAK